MPGVTPGLSLPYPYANETVDSVSVKNLADAVDAALNTSITNATLTNRRPAALVKRTTGTQSFASGAALANLTYTTEMFDNDAMGNLGTNNERLTITTAGVYLISAFWSLDPSTNGSEVTSSNAIITVNGTLIAGRKTRFTLLGAFSVMHRLSAADVIRQQFTWTGTNSPKNVTQAALAARWICSL